MPISPSPLPPLMKLSSTTSFDLGSNDAAAGCLSGILRRLLCGGLRRPAPRDGEEEGTTLAREWKAAEQKKPPPAPGIVARLMGLESMPVFPYPPPDSIGRSRSTNTLDSWPGFLSDQRKSGSPQIRTSLSFREVPTYLRQENEDFLLLSFTPDDGEVIFSSNGMEPVMGFEELKEPRAEGASKANKESGTERRTVKRRNGRRDCCRNKASEQSNNDDKDSIPPPTKDVHRKPRRGVKADSSVKPTKHRAERSINAKKKPAHASRRVESECSSQDSSPDSVLYLHLDTDGEYLLSPGSPVSEDRTPKQRNSRRKLSSDLVDLDSASPSIHLTKFCSDGGMRSLDEGRSKSRKPKQSRRDFSNMCREICRLAEDDMLTSNWLSREMCKGEDVGEIVAAFGLEILDFLLHEAVVELFDCIITR